MSTKINIATVAAFLALVAAPQLASAQAIFLPSTQRNADHRQQLNIPSDARASAGTVNHRRGSQGELSNTVVIDNGQVVGQDPDAHIRFELRRDDHRGEY